MTEGTAIKLAENRMEELGITNYLIRYRHFQIGALESIEIKAENQLYYLIHPSRYVTVQTPLPTKTKIKKCSMFQTF